MIFSSQKLTGLACIIRPSAYGSVFPTLLLRELNLHLRLCLADQTNVFLIPCNANAFYHSFYVQCMSILESDATQMYLGGRGAASVDRT